MGIIRKNFDRCSISSPQVLSCCLESKSTDSREECIFYLESLAREIVSKMGCFSVNCNGVGKANSDDDGPASLGDGNSVVALLSLEAVIGNTLKELVLSTTNSDTSGVQGSGVG